MNRVAGVVLVFMLTIAILIGWGYLSQPSESTPTPTPTPAPTWTPQPSPTPTSTPTPTPTPTPTSRPKYGITIKTVDQHWDYVDGAIYVDGNRVGERLVVFDAEVGVIYRVTFGSLEGYHTPDGVTFSLGPDGFLEDGTRTITGVYTKIEEDKARLIVEVRVYSNTLKTSYPLADAYVETLGMAAYTNDNGIATLYVPKKSGTILVKVYYDLYGWTSKYVTIDPSAEYTKTTIYYVTSGLSLLPIQYLLQGAAGQILAILTFAGFVILLLIRRSKKR